MAAPCRAHYIHRDSNKNPPSVGGGWGVIAYITVMAHPAAATNSVSLAMMSTRETYLGGPTQKLL